MDESTRDAICKAAQAEAATWPSLTDDQVEELRFLLSQRAAAHKQRGAA